MNEFARNVNAAIVLVIAGVLFGSIFVEFYMGVKPCPLCFLQKLAMIGFAASELLNLKFGVRTEHYALSYLSALFGSAVSISQILLHICPNPDMYPPMVVFGLGLYTWAFIVFVCAILANSILLFLYKPQVRMKRPAKLGTFPMIAFILISLITLANIFDAVYDLLI